MPLQPELVFYPKEFPAAQLRRGLASITSGGVFDDPARTLKDAWHVGGYASGATVGDPDAVGLTSAAVECDCTDEQCDELERFGHALTTLKAPASGPAAMNPFVLSLLLKYGPIVAEAIAEFLEKRRNRNR